MSWRTIAAVMVVLLTMVVLLPLTTVGLPQVQDSLNATGDYDSRYVDGNSAFFDMVDAIYKGVLIVLFGTLGWAIVWIVRRESTLKGRRP